jgi:pyruvate formate lyase activating enzyme
MNKLLPIIRGLNKCSEAGLDVFAPSIFLGTCNLRCPYCMNSKLVTDEVTNVVSIEDIKGVVDETKSEWLMISGGEPTCTGRQLLINLLEEIKSWGCKIGMSTNGTNSLKFSHIIQYLDYVAMDIKTSRSKLVYSDIYAMNVMKTIYRLRKTKKHRTDFDYELRTTLYPYFINENDIKVIGAYLNKDEKWVFQQFRHSKNMIDASCAEVAPYSDEEVQKLITLAKQFCDNVSIRYV